MNNLLDNVLDALGRNKKNLVIAIVAYVVIMLAVVVMIWWPDKKDYLEYKQVNLSQKQQQLAQTYIDDISLLFNLEEVDEISNLISDEYVLYTGQSKREIIEELQDSGFFSLYSEIRGVDIYTDENTYVYSTTIYHEGNSRKINIIEKYPYDYEITFDDFYKYNVVQKTTTSEDIEFEISSIYNNLRYIEFNMKIKNLNSTHARFDFNTPTCVQAVLSDGRIYSVSNLVSTSDYTYVDANTTITRNFVFEIPAQLQNSIEYIVFNGVVLQYSTADIKVNI